MHACCAPLPSTGARAARATNGVPHADDWLADAAYFANLEGTMTVSPWERADPLFRFVEVRAPELVRGDKEKLLPRVRSYFPDQPTAFHKALRTLAKKGDTEGMLTVALKFIGDKDRSDWDAAEFRGRRDAVENWFW